MKYEFTPIAVEAARRAGDVLRNGLNSTFGIKQKSSLYDVVTDCDHAAEETIISYVRSHYPTHAFLAEESGASSLLESPVCWIIDPLDGTLNFSHRIPMFCVSIAVMVNAVLEVGVIYHPMLNELFIAERGHGAMLNEEKISVSKAQDLNLSYISTGYPYELAQSAPSLGVPIRVIGSAALSLAYVAAGRFDAYLGTNLYPWDVAAGVLMIEEAGGAVCHFDGTPHNMFSQTNIIAGTKALTSPIRAHLLQKPT